MTLSNRTHLLSFLEEIGASPQKRLSQNFLVDANMLRKILRAADIQPSDRILEIGPGPGAWTEALLQTGASISAIEKDRLFAHTLRRFPKLDVLEGDFLEMPLRPFAEARAPLKIIANLPFHIATPAIEKLCQEHASLSCAILLIQREMAERMMAQPNTKAYSSFTIFVQSHASVSCVAKVPRTCFYPSPNVDSSVVRLSFRPPPLADMQPFFALVRKAFQQRRKMLRSTLSITGEFAEKRPEALSLTDWLRLFQDFYAAVK